MDIKQYLEIFIEETKEHLVSLNQLLLQLEKNPHDGTAINEIFRVAHTLKGMSGTMGFNKMSALTHNMEDVLDALRGGKIDIDEKLIDILFRCLDALEDYLNNIIDKGNEGRSEYGHIIADLNSVVKDGTVSRDTPREEESGKDTSYISPDFSVNEYEQNVIDKALELGMNVFKITVVLNKGCLLKSARAFIIFQTLERYSEIIKSEPRVEDIEDEKFDFEFTVLVVTKEAPEVLTESLNSIAEVENVIITPVGYQRINGAEEKRASPLDVDSAKDKLHISEGDIETHANQDDLKTDSFSKKAKTGKTVRIEISRLDVLLNLVSELIIQKTRLDEMVEVGKSQEITETIEYLERITTSLHDAVMKVRMVPIETVFNRFPRMIRDISRDLGKEVIFNMSGEETELDRTVVDEIGEPLIHLLRNSIDHGIEPVEQRERLGKPPVGRIDLRAYQDGSNVVIEVEDDGQGINIEKVKSKAIERGLIPKDMEDNLSKKDIIDFLFRPSFSTADVVTDLSGRGVGLDVVKTKIESLGGVVEVETESGKGSKFIIRLPLTLAIIQALLVKIGDEKYAIQLSSIKQIIKITRDDIKLVQNQEVILLRNTIIPIIRLNRVLKVPQEETEKKQLTVVIVRKGDRLSGFLVDSILGQQEIVQKPLGKFLSGIKTITSATILGDGNVALILDVNSLAV